MSIDPATTVVGLVGGDVVRIALRPRCCASLRALGDAPAVEQVPAEEERHG